MKIEWRKDLLPCPFCGYSPCHRFVPNPNGEKYPGHHEIWCESLSCEVGIEVSEVDLADAERIWNRREPSQWSSDRGAQALRVVRQMVEAFDSGSLRMESPEIGEPENDIPYHPWHEEMLHYARLALEPSSVSSTPRQRCAECDCGDGECNWIAESK